MEHVATAAASRRRAALAGVGFETPAVLGHLAGQRWRSPQQRPVSPGVDPSPITTSTGYCLLQINLST
jgi:hypothetical protein